MRIGLPLDPGALDRRVTIQYRTDGSSTSGFGMVDDWTTTASVSVYMMRGAISGVERVQAQQMSARADTRWVMHYRTDMDPDTVDVAKDRRLLFNGRTFNITAAEVLGNKAAIVLTALAKVG